MNLILVNLTFRDTILIIVDARHLPREIQEVAYRKGLIPYIPD